MYISLDKYEQFADLADFPRERVTQALISSVRGFHEANDLEELLLQVMTDPNRTPHGPVEIVDIMTLQLTHRGKEGVAAFILKGRSFQTVTPAHISHQVFRLRKISDLKFAIFGHSGNLLDEAREEFIHTAIDLSVDYTIIDAVDFARLAVVFGVLCPRDAERLQNGRCRCGYRAGGSNLNVLQRQALNELQTIHELKQDSGVIIMPTGSGKTRIAAIDSYNFGAQRVLYVAHTHEILDGAEREFSHIYGHQVISRGHTKQSPANNTPTIDLITIQSARRDKFLDQEYDYVIIDEFHHAAAKSYRTLIAQIRPKFLLGLTATPFRVDRQDVVELCKGNVIVDFELRTGIDTGILAPYHYYGCFDDVDFSTLQQGAQGYSIRDLDKALIIPQRDAAIISKWEELADNLPTLAFCCSQQHAKRMVASFNDAGIPAEEYIGTTATDRRMELVERLQYGDIKILCTVDVLNEGIDLPFIQCLLFLRPTESKRIFFQQLGRGLRKSPGKQQVIVLDFIGNFYNAYRIVEYFGLQPEEQLIYTSNGRIRSSKDVLNLPLGCKVFFEDRVIDIFARQILDPRTANRHNIARILIYLYRKTSRYLGKRATKRDIDRHQIINSDYYKLVFGSWNEFEKMIAQEEI